MIFRYFIRSNLVLIGILGGILLYPYLTTGFYFDDSLNASMRHVFESQGLSLWQEMVKNAIHWITYDGRFYPLASLTMAVQYYATQPFTYHVVILVFVSLSLITFYGWLRSLEINPDLAAFLVAIQLCLFQIRGYHDPLTSYACLLPISAILGFGSSWLFNRSLEKHASWRLFVSQILLFSAFLFYEVNLVFLYLHLAAAWKKPHWKRVGWPLSITALYFVITFYLRLTHPSHYPGTILSFSFRALKTYLFQLSAALPLTYPLFGRAGFYKGWTVLNELCSIRTFLIYSICLLVFHQLLNRISKTKVSEASTSARWSAWSLFFLPAAMIAMTQKYQDEITRPGQGYLPVYLSYFGTSVWLGLFLAKRLRPSKIRLISTLLGGVATLTFTTNLIAASAMNFIWKDPREMMEKALQAKILKNAFNNKAFVNGTDHYWFNSTYLDQWHHPKTDITGYSQFFGKNPQGEILLNFNVVSSDLGWIAMAPVQKFQNQKYSSSGPIQIWFYHHDRALEKAGKIELRLSPTYSTPIQSLKLTPLTSSWSYLTVNIEVEDLFAWRYTPLLQRASTTHETPLH